MQAATEDIIKILPKGLITIPKKFRRKLGMEDNSLVRVKEEKGKLIMEAVRTFPYPIRTYTKEELMEFLDLDKRETKSLKKKGLL